MWPLSSIEPSTDGEMCAPEGSIRREEGGESEAAEHRFSTAATTAAGHHHHHHHHHHHGSNHDHVEATHSGCGIPASAAEHASSAMDVDATAASAPASLTESSICMRRDGVQYNERDDADNHAPSLLETLPVGSVGGGDAAAASAAWPIYHTASPLVSATEQRLQHELQQQHDHHQQQPVGSECASQLSGIELHVHQQQPVPGGAASGASEGYRAPSSTQMVNASSPPLSHAQSPCGIVVHGTTASHILHVHHHHPTDTSGGSSVPLHSPVTTSHCGGIPLPPPNGLSFGCNNCQRPLEATRDGAPTRELLGDPEGIGLGMGRAARLLGPGHAPAGDTVGTVADGEVGVGEGEGMPGVGAAASLGTRVAGDARRLGRNERIAGKEAAMTTPESLGMHQLFDQKHWAAVYIKPNSVYKRRPFSSLKDRKRRDLVAAGFAVFHKICESMSHGEADDFMKAILQSSNGKRMTRGLRQDSSKFSDAFIQQQALAYSVAPPGPNGRTRVLTTMANLMTDAEIRHSFKRHNGQPPSAYEIALARSQRECIKKELKDRVTIALQADLRSHDC